VDQAELRRRAHAWVEKHAAEQGLSVKVTNPATIEYAAAILASGRKNRRQA
jgi:hypothetical protein